MRASIDISLYPLAEDYAPAVKDFIDRLERGARELTDCHVVRGDLSTQIFGAFPDLLRLLADEIPASWAHWGKGAFVLKVLRDDLRGIGTPDVDPP